MKNTSSLQNNYASRLRRVSGNPAIVCLRCVTGGAFWHELYDCQPCLSVARKSGIYYRATAVGLLRCATGNKMPKAPVIPVTRDEAVDINTYILICCRPVAIRRSFRLPRPFPTRDFSPPTTKPLAGAGKQNRHSDERD